MPVRIACFGGLYSNYLALEAALRDAARRGVDAVYCLGDMGAFGPHPDRVFPLLRDPAGAGVAGLPASGVDCVQGNYDDSVGRELADCQCGYVDPRDNHFAAISYAYTLTNTSPEHRRWLAALPPERILEIGARRILLCHGSPRRTNEFLWESTTSTPFLDRLADERQIDAIVATHSGIKWERKLAGGRRFINVGVLGRPENDGRTNVWYALLTIDEQAAEQAGQSDPGRAIATPSEPAAHSWLQVEFVPIAYDHRRLAREMADERLPEEFQETVLTGWWTTCLEILPAKERRRGRF